MVLISTLLSSSPLPLKTFAREHEPNSRANQINFSHLQSHLIGFLACATIRDQTTPVPEPTKGYLGHFFGNVKIWRKRLCHFCVTANSAGEWPL